MLSSLLEQLDIGFRQLPMSHACLHEIVTSLTVYGLVVSFHKVLVPVRLIPFRLILILSPPILSNLVLSTMQTLEVNIG